MTFNEMKSRFQSILNRSDCDDDQATICLQDALGRIARTARLPNMERTVITTVRDQPEQFLAIPPDLLQVIDIYVDDCQGQPQALDLKSYRDLLRYPKGGEPFAYSRFQGTFVFRGAVPKGRDITLLYYGEFSDFPNGDSENEISASNPDLVIYGALPFAADIFDHPSKDAWEARYQSMLSEVIGLGADLDTLGGSTAINSMYQD